MNGERFVTPLRSSLPAARQGPAIEGPGVQHEGFDLPALTSAVAEARERVCGRLRSWGLPEGLEDTARLVVSEFVTNAIVHTESGSIRCRLQLCGERLRIEVVDEGGCPSAVRPREAESGDVDGRGLQLVGAVAEEWGVHSGGSCPGRTVWAELSLTAP